MMMYRVTLRVEGVPPEIGAQAAADITASFKERPWQENAVCAYIDGGLTFISENDFDEEGLATQDEFAHEYSGNVPIFDEDNGNLRIERVESF
ncbi:MAG: hypothetical protein ABI147_06255 [Acidobacteriaceae bacterium]